jgi:hypothetical protein
MLNDSEEKNKLLNSILQKKNEIENYYKTLDKIVYDTESKYLEATQNTGNILKGWEQIFTTKPKNIAQTLNTNKKTKFTNSERLFSQTSFNNHMLKDDFLQAAQGNLLS